MRSPGHLLTIARTRAITRDTLSPANRPVASSKDASRDVARVVSDVSVLCPPAGAESDNSSSRRDLVSQNVRPRRLARLLPHLHREAGNRGRARRLLLRPALTRARCPQPRRLDGTSRAAGAVERRRWRTAPAPRGMPVARLERSLLLPSASRALRS